MVYKCNLSRGAIVSPEDEYLLKIHLFRVELTGYLVTKVNQKAMYLHKMIMPEKDKRVDHINRNKLDNRRENLRYATYAQNAHNVGLSIRNKTGYKGVSIDKWGRCFYVRLAHDGLIHYLGTYTTPEEAAKVYDKAALKYHGDFAALNFSS